MVPKSIVTHQQKKNRTQQHPRLKAAGVAWLSEHTDPGTVHSFSLNITLTRFVSNLLEYHCAYGGARCPNPNTTCIPNPLDRIPAHASELCQLGDLGTAE
eukprot:scaffold181997_cov21-Prasinocladus_malaysianus.AAC.1